MISVEVKGSIGGDIWKGVCRYSVTSAAAMEEWSLNTSVKCLANRLAFSIGLRAHPPCGRQIGGIICGGRVSFLEAFHREWSRLWGTSWRDICENGHNCSFLWFWIVF